MTDPSILLPAARSTTAGAVDSLYLFILWMSVFLFVLIVGAAGYFAWKYRRREGDETKLSSPTFHSTALEVFWSVGPLLVCIGLFHVGVKQYMDNRIAPGDALEVRVRAQKWSWEFEYPNGKIDSDLTVPVGKPVRLIMTSKDVIHSFFVPDFRIKQDAVPGRYSTVWFQAVQEGEDQVFCTEYCGKDHSAMLAKVKVVSEAKFKEFIDFDDTKTMPLAEIGADRYKKKACNGCHSLDGSKIAGGGPSFKGLYGREEEMTTGAKVVVDDGYIRESILNPQAKIVKGFQPVMPTFQGSLKDREIEGIIEFIKAQKLVVSTRSNRNGSHRHRSPGQ
jgi:cytochrome c oxidase subunit II